MDSCARTEDRNDNEQYCLNHVGGLQLNYYVAVMLLCCCFVPETACWNVGLDIARRYDKKLCAFERESYNYVFFVFGHANVCCAQNETSLPGYRVLDWL
jgi:hypothetical protein